MSKKSGLSGLNGSGVASLEQLETTAIQQAQPSGLPSFVLNGFTDEQLAQLKSIFAAPARDPKNTITDDEFELFIGRCVHTGLDPFHRQISVIKRGGKVSIEPTIDGLRLIAHRTGRFAGYSPTYWADNDGSWHEIWRKAWGYPAAAKIAVYVKGASQPFPGIAFWEEYAPSFYDKFEKRHKLSDMWDKLPAHMIAKVAESMALRRAFPFEMSGLYLREEMSNFDDVTHAPAHQPTQPNNQPNRTSNHNQKSAAPTYSEDEQRARETAFSVTNDLMKTLGWNADKGRAYLMSTYGLRSRQELSIDQLIEFSAHLQSLAAEQQAQTQETIDITPSAISEQVDDSDDDQDYDDYLDEPED